MGNQKERQEENKMDQKLKVGILGATGMVGQRFISLLEDHPWFEVVTAVSYTHLDVYKRQGQWRKGFSGGKRR